MRFLTASYPAGIGLEPRAASLPGSQIMPNAWLWDTIEHPARFLPVATLQAYSFSSPRSLPAALTCSVEAGEDIEDFITQRGGIGHAQKLKVRTIGGRSDWPAQGNDRERPTGPRDRRWMPSGHCQRAADSSLICTLRYGEAMQTTLKPPALINCSILASSAPRVHDALTPDGAELDVADPELLADSQGVVEICEISSVMTRDVACESFICGQACRLGMPAVCVSVVVDEGGIGSLSRPSSRCPCRPSSLRRTHWLACVLPGS